MRIAFVRHGQTDWNIQRRYQGWEGLDLNDVGRTQASEVGARLLQLGQGHGIGWSWISSSTAPRAAQTARIIADRLGLTPSTQVFGDLREQGFGVVEGMLINEARTRWPDRRYPGGESMPDVLARALRGVDAVAIAHAEAGTTPDGVFVTHGTTLRLLVGHVTGEDPGSLPNGAIAVLEGEPGAWHMAVHPSDDE